MFLRRVFPAVRPVDLLTFGFLAFLFAVTVYFIKQLPNAVFILLMYIVLSASLSLLIYFKEKNNNKIIRMTYDIVFPVITVFLIFDSLGGLIRYINPKTYDHLLIRMDYLLFGGYPTVALESFTHPVITELLQLAYASYYFLPVVLGAALKIKGKDGAFNKSLFFIILCFYLSYIGYILFPAIGPRYTMNHLQNIELHGIFLRDIIDNTLNALEGTKRDAFPSGHTAVTLVVLYLAYRFQKPLYYIFLPAVLALLVSTVYLRYHYAVDVIGGVLLAVFTVYAGEKCYDCLSVRSSS
ncbi:MAG: phosphatase PAP2 family protein [Nitrospirae bacterium]|nr:phosphatase PAP2 family protein [Nitrospirota bacterium]